MTKKSRCMQPVTSLNIFFTAHPMHYVQEFCDNFFFVIDNLKEIWEKYAISVLEKEKTQ